MSLSRNGIIVEREEPLDEDNWKLEAEGVINDVKAHVQNIQISSKIKSCNTHIYLNIETLEGDLFCIEMSAAGFRIVGNSFDDMTCPQDKFFETPYSVLDAVSPKYRASFGNALLSKLQDLQQECSAKDPGD